MPLDQLAERLVDGGALFGLDYGTKTIGIAVSDAGWRVASPLQTIRRSKFSVDCAALLALAARYDVRAIVIGLPMNMDGTAGPRVQATRDFARNLAKSTDLPLGAWDERWSTVAAERALIETDASRAKRREMIDKVAAAIILQGALDRMRAGPLPNLKRD